MLLNNILKSSKDIENGVIILYEVDSWIQLKIEGERQKWRKICEIYLFIRILIFLLCYIVDVGFYFVILSGEGIWIRLC